MLFTFKTLMMAGGFVSLLTLDVNATPQANLNKPEAKPTLIADCRLADGRSATVTASGPRFTYRFGRKKSPELELVGDTKSNTVFKSQQSYPRAGWTAIRFVNGSSSYALFHYFNLGNYVRNYEGATEKSGLLVFQKGRKPSMRICKTADGLEDDTDIAALPDDPEDHSDDIIDDAERHH